VLDWTSGTSTRAWDGPIVSDDRLAAFVDRLDEVHDLVALRIELQGALSAEQAATAKLDDAFALLGRVPALQVHRSSGSARAAASLSPAACPHTTPRAGERATVGRSQAAAERRARAGRGDGGGGTEGAAGRPPGASARSRGAGAGQPRRGGARVWRAALSNLPGALRQPCTPARSRHTPHPNPPPAIPPTHLSTLQELLRHRFLLGRRSVASQLEPEHDAAAHLAASYLSHIAAEVAKADSVACAVESAGDDATLSALVRVIVWLKQTAQRVLVAGRAVRALLAGCDRQAALAAAAAQADALQELLLADEQVRGAWKETGGEAEARAPLLCSCHDCRLRCCDRARSARDLCCCSSGLQFC